MGFMTGRKIYENFTNGVGPEGLAGSAALVNQLAAEYLEEGDAIRRLTAKMESVWQGDAAGAARRGAGPLAVEHEMAAPHMATAQDLNGRQAESFVDARNAVVPVPPEPGPPDPWALFRGSGEAVDYRQQVMEYNAANQHNVDVMTGYAGASSYNGKGMPQEYGSLTADQAEIAVGSGASAPVNGPRGGGPEVDHVGVPGAVEWAGRGPGWVESPPEASVPAESGGRPQETTPGGAVSVPGGPGAPIPVGSGGSGGPGSGSVPGTGFVPVGGGVSDGFGGRGQGGAGRGPESDVRGPGGRADGGESRGRPLAGGVSGEPHAAGRGGVGGGAGRGGGLSGVPMAAGSRARGAEDEERYAPDYLREEDPDGVFGADELTAPPVIGLEPVEEQPSVG